MELIGKGQFGSVYKCVNRLDGCVYAVKKSTKPVAGSSFEKTALNEVYAHAVLGKLLLFKLCLIFLPYDDYIILILLVNNIPHL